MRTGFLSDESIMMLCAEYHPIPLGKASAILSPHGKTPKPKSPIETRGPKYVQPPHRPATFGALANSIARHQNNPIPIQRQMNEMYEKELGHSNVAPNNDAMSDNNNGAYDTDDDNMPDADLNNRANDLFQEMDAGMNTPPQAPPPPNHGEKRKRDTIRMEDYGHKPKLRAVNFPTDQGEKRKRDTIRKEDHGHDRKAKRLNEINTFRIPNETVYAYSHGKRPMGSLDHQEEVDRHVSQIAKY